MEDLEAQDKKLSSPTKHKDYDLAKEPDFKGTLSSFSVVGHKYSSETEVITMLVEITTN